MISPPVTSRRLLLETLTSQFTQFPIELIYFLALKIKSSQTLNV